MNSTPEEYRQLKNELALRESRVAFLTAERKAAQLRIAYLEAVQQDAQGAAARDRRAGFDAGVSEMLSVITDRTPGLPPAVRTHLMDEAGKLLHQ